MKEEELYGLLYMINCHKDQYDQKIGVVFTDIYVHESDFFCKVMPIQMQDGAVCGLTMENLETLFHTLLSLNIKSKRSTMVNEVLSRELSSVLRKCIYTVDDDIPFTSEEELNVLIEKAAHFIEVCKGEEKQYQKEASKFFAKTKYRTVTSEDGFEVRYKVFGQEKLQTMVLINAYGIPSEIWRNMICYFSSEYQVIVWETRGTIPEHTNINMQPVMFSKDLEQILKKECIYKAMLVCWCSGLKVLAEFYKRNPDMVSSVVIIAGYFNPFPETGSYWSDFDRSIGKIAKMIVKDNSLLKNPLLLGLIQKLFQLDIGEKRMESLLSSEVDEEERFSIQNTLVRNAADEVKRFITLPFDHNRTLQNYAKITINLQKHEILTILSGIVVPTLILNAGKDMVTDIRSAKEGQTYIRNSQMAELPDATHWCIWENYREVISEIEQFILRTSKMISIPGKAEENEG